jgi:hypothetical protein
MHTKFCLENLERRNHFIRPGHRWEDMKIIFREIGFGCLCYVHLDLRIATSGRIISITRRTSFHRQSNGGSSATVTCCVAKTHYPLDSIPYDCGRLTLRHAT